MDTSTLNTRRHSAQRSPAASRTTSITLIPNARLMRVDARSQMVERWRSMLIHRLVLSGEASRQGSDCDSMRHSAGTAGKDQVCGEQAF